MCPVDIPNLAASLDTMNPTLVSALRHLKAVQGWLWRCVCVPFLRRGRGRLLASAARLPACSWRRLALAPAALLAIASANRALSPSASTWFPDLSFADASPSGPPRNRALDYPWLPLRRACEFESLKDRMACPPGYVRTAVAPNGFAEWLRHLPVAPAGSPVRTSTKAVVLDADHPALAAVIELEPLAGKLNAGVNMLLRLRAEFGWWCQDYDILSFHYACGLRSDWRAWSAGQRPVTCEKGLRLEETDPPDAGRASFCAWLDALLRHSSGGGVLDDTRSVSDATVAAGDILVDPAAGGTALMILDVAMDATGHVRVLLGEAGTPAQTFHVLKGGDGSAWFPISQAGCIDLGPRGPFDLRHLRRWAR